jgi:hypothetical protein
MPTLLDKDGYKFFFYANEHLPKHVHVLKGEWLCQNRTTLAKGCRELHEAGRTKERFGNCRKISI